MMAIAHRDRMALAGGLLLMVVIVGAGRGLPALRAWERERTTLALETRRQLVAAEAALAALPHTRDSARAREQRLRRMKANMVSASTPEAAAAALAARAESMAEEEGVSVGSLTLRPDSTIRAGMARVGVRMTLEGDVEGLAGFLYAVESHEIPIMVRELSVAQAEPLAPSNRMEVLRFEVLLTSLASIAGKPRAEKGR